MTALQDFARLECAGLWRAAPAEQRRDVIVSFGEATLVMTDAAGRVLAHWSLPAIERINPGQMPALFSADPDRAELLEIEDDLMISALDKIRRSVARKAPHPGRLRLVLVLAMLAGLGALGTFWLPGALLTQASKAMRPSAAQQIDEQITREMALLLGPPCQGPDGAQSLNMLAHRLALPGGIVVFPGELPGPIILPGGTILLDRAMIELPDDPAVPAGYALLADTHRSAALRSSLSKLSLPGTLSLLATGQMRDQDARAIALHLVSHAQPRASANVITARFAEAQISSRPWMLDESHADEGNPTMQDEPAQPQESREALPDPQWLALQNICEM